MRILAIHSYWPFALSLALGLGVSNIARADWASYLSDYRATAEWKTGAASSALRYDAARSATLPDNCVNHANDPGLMACSLEVGKKNKPYYAFGIEQAFKRQGFWYFGADIGASIFLLDAKAEETETSVTLIQPIPKARAHIYGLNARAYLQMGITPQSIWPDLLLSIGVGEHLSTGNFKIGNVREKMNIAAGMGYVQFEAVWWRFKDGSLSSYVSTESGGSYRLKENYGAFQNLKVQPSMASFGLIKLVIPYKTK